MNSNSLENDDLLEKAIDKFVNDREQFQSRHFKNPKQQPYSSPTTLKKLQTMPRKLLIEYVFRKTNRKIHRSFKKTYYEHLESLDKERLVGIGNKLIEKEKDSKNESEMESEIKQKLQI